MFRPLRRFKQALSEEECVRILKTERRGVLAVHGDDGYPYAIPLNFYYNEDENRIYFHCAKEGHKIDAIQNNDKICFSVWDGGEQKDGDWSYYVNSVVIFGRAKLITDTEEALKQVKIFGMKYYPKEEEAAVDAEIRQLANRLQMVTISVEHMSGKHVHEK